jgi:glycosyltransferase involved in cell wall biosynthesis
MISIITPVYNGDRFIESCIKTVIEQHCSDIEHIIVDGGSKDQTVEIVKRYAEQYSHIRWISEKDRGQSDAMNKGIAMAKGNILAILNVDDYYEPGVLNRILELFSELPEPSLLVGNCNIWGDTDKLLYVNKPERLSFLRLLLGPEVTPFPENPSAYFYHKSLHEKIGSYSVDENYALDLDFLLRAVQVAHVKYVDETWGNFRRFEGTKTFSIMQSKTHGSINQRVIEKFYKQLPLHQKVFMMAVYTFYKPLDPKFRYILDDPRNIFEIIGNKLSRLYARS